MRSSTPLLKNLLARGLLALAFLFAQQTATLHWLSHAIDAAQDASQSVRGELGEQQAGVASAPLDHCDECLLLGALGAAAASSLATLPLTFAQHTLTGSPLASTAPAPLRLAFRSRAPPILC